MCPATLIGSDSLTRFVSSWVYLVKLYCSKMYTFSLLCTYIDLWHGAPDILLVGFIIALDAESDLSRVSATRRQVWKYTISFTNAKLDWVGFQDPCPALIDYWWPELVFTVRIMWHSNSKWSSSHELESASHAHNRSRTLEDHASATVTKEWALVPVAVRHQSTSL